MSKSILVIDTPTVCYNCPLDCNNYSCTVTGSKYFRQNTRFNPYEEKLNDCPLKELPEEADDPHLDEYYLGFTDGWNSLLSEIIGDLK